MAKGIFIVGTDTNVGKTVACAGIMYLLRSKGLNAAYYKPILSGALVVEGRLTPGDTEFVKCVSGFEEDNELISPFCLKEPLSPHVASRLEGRNIDMSVVKDNLGILASKYDYIVAEGCGGLAVPLNGDFYMLYDLIKDIGMDVIVVTRSGLGTINHTTLTVKFAQYLGINVKGLIVNGYQGSAAEDDNIEAVRRTTQIPILGVIGRMDDVDTEKMNAGSIKDVFDNRFDFNKFLVCMENIYGQNGRTSKYGY